MAANLIFAHLKAKPVTEVEVTSSDAFAQSAFVKDPDRFYKAVTELLGLNMISRSGSCLKWKRAIHKHEFIQCESNHTVQAFVSLEHSKLRAQIESVVVESNKKLAESAKAQADSVKAQADSVKAQAEAKSAEIQMHLTSLRAEIERIQLAEVLAKLKKRNNSGSSSIEPDEKPLQ